MGAKSDRRGAQRSGGIHTDGKFREKRLAHSQRNNLERREKPKERQGAFQRAKGRIERRERHIAMVRAENEERVHI